MNYVNCTKNFWSFRVLLFSTHREDSNQDKYVYYNTHTHTQTNTHTHTHIHPFTIYIQMKYVNWTVNVAVFPNSALLPSSHRSESNCTPLQTKHTHTYTQTHKHIHTYLLPCILYIRIFPKDLVMLVPFLPCSPEGPRFKSRPWVRSSLLTFVPFALCSFYCYVHDCMSNYVYIDCSLPHFTPFFIHC